MVQLSKHGAFMRILGVKSETSEQNDEEHESVRESSCDTARDAKCQIQNYIVLQTLRDKPSAFMMKIGYLAP